MTRRWLLTGPWPHGTFCTNFLWLKAHAVTLESDGRWPLARFHSQTWSLSKGEAFMKKCGRYLKDPEWNEMERCGVVADGSRVASRPCWRRSACVAGFRQDRETDLRDVSVQSWILSHCWSLIATGSYMTSLLVYSFLFRPVCGHELINGLQICVSRWITYVMENTHTHTQRQHCIYCTYIKPGKVGAIRGNVIHTFILTYALCQLMPIYYAIYKGSSNKCYRLPPSQQSWKATWTPLCWATRCAPVTLSKMSKSIAAMLLSELGILGIRILYIDNFSRKVNEALVWCKPEGVDLIGV